MKGFAKRLLAYVLLCGLYATIGVAISYSIYMDMKLSTTEEIQSLNNITNNESREFIDAISVSRNSAVNVMSMSVDGVTLQGTYFAIMFARSMIFVHLP